MAIAAIAEGEQAVFEMGQARLLRHAALDEGHGVVGRIAVTAGRRHEQQPRACAQTRRIQLFERHGIGRNAGIAQLLGSAQGNVLGETRLAGENQGQRLGAGSKRCVSGAVSGMSDAALVLAPGDDGAQGPVAADHGDCTQQPGEFGRDRHGVEKPYCGSTSKVAT